jgi:hypothetical protein
LVAEQLDVVSGFLHFDAFVPEPELHRLYVESEVRSAGVGTALMHELHTSLHKTAKYMLLVVAGNEQAIRFYERHGLHIAEYVDGLTYYRQRMRLHFAEGTKSFREPGSLPGRGRLCIGSNCRAQRLRQARANTSGSGHLQRGRLGPVGRSCPSGSSTQSGKVDAKNESDRRWDRWLGQSGARCGARW